MEAIANRVQENKISFETNLPFQRHLKCFPPASKLELQPKIITLGNFFVHFDFEATHEQERYKEQPNYTASQSDLPTSSPKTLTQEYAPLPSHIVCNESVIYECNVTLFGPY
jgi:hypothetical protein